MSSLTWWEQYRRGIQAALELVLKTSRTVKRMGIDTSPFCKIFIRSTSTVQRVRSSDK